MIQAAALANARSFGGEDYIGFHTLMALKPAYGMAQQLPKATSWNGRRAPMPSNWLGSTRSLPIKYYAISTVRFATRIRLKLALKYMPTAQQGIKFDQLSMFFFDTQRASMARYMLRNIT